MTLKSDRQPIPRLAEGRFANVDLGGDQTMQRMVRQATVKFEQLVSFRPRLSNTVQDSAPCLRDMVFDYYCRKYQDTDKADATTKAYLDAIWEQYGNGS